MFKTLRSLFQHSETDLPSAAGQDTLACDPDPQVRVMLALDPALSEDVQRLLAGDPDLGVRKALALNESLTEEVQRLFVSRAAAEMDTDPFGGPSLCVLRTLAANRALAEDLQRVLAGNADLLVRFNLSTNVALVVDDRLPVPFLRDDERGQRVMDARLADVDPAVRDVLTPEWEGQLGDLVAACESFAADPA